MHIDDVLFRRAASGSSDACRAGGLDHRSCEEEQLGLMGDFTDRDLFFDDRPTFLAECVMLPVNQHSTTKMNSSEIST